MKKLTLAHIFECILFIYCHLFQWKLVELKRGDDRWRERLWYFYLRQLATVDGTLRRGIFPRNKILRLVNGENFLLLLCKHLCCKDCCLCFCNCCLYTKAGWFPFQGLAESDALSPNYRRHFRRVRRHPGRPNQSKRCQHSHLFRQVKGCHLNATVLTANSAIVHRCAPNSRAITWPERIVHSPK
jgi:hypothetical protein